METQLYIGIMSGTSMDGADAVLVRMDGGKWLGAEGHAFTPTPAGYAANCWICRTQARTNCTAAGCCRKNSAAYMRKPWANY